MYHAREGVGGERRAHRAARLDRLTRASRALLFSLAVIVLEDADLVAVPRCIGELDVATDSPCFHLRPD
jgi:hypothetical protein